MKLTPNRIACQQAVELASDYLEGALSRRDRKRLERHLAECDACTAYLEQLRVTIAASGVVTPDDLGPDVLETLAAIYQKFHEDDGD
jgi:anti-sigma factor RsiW